MSPTAVRNTIRFSAALGLMLLCAACASNQPAVRRIALLAPFEGRNAELGYNALYAARLALDDGPPSIELIPVDDGGTVELAALRARALAADPSVTAAIGLGPLAADPQVQAAFDDLPLLVVGRWSEVPAAPGVLTLSTDQVAPEAVRADASAEEAASAAYGAVGYDVLGLQSFRALRGGVVGDRLITSGLPADRAFSEQYAAQGQFVPQPNHLAMLVADAVDMLAQPALAARKDLPQFLRQGDFAGQHYHFSFRDGQWANAPANCLLYDGRGLLPAADDAVCQR